MENVKNKPMLQAVEKCCPSQLKCLLDLEGDVNRVLDESGNTALHLTALETARLACARVLIESGADPDVKNKEGETPLHVACRSRNDHFVRLLVSEKATFNIDSKDDSGATALMICAINKRESIVDILIEAGANVNVVNNSGYSALHYANILRYPCSNSFEKLLMKSDINLRTVDGLSAFQVAIEMSSVDNAFLLFDQRSDLNVYETDRFENTIVHRVIQRKKGDYLITITNLCDFDLLHHKNKLRMTPMHDALRMWQPYDEGVRMLLMHDTKQIPVNCPPRTLFISIIRKDESSLKTVLSNGVDIDQVDSCGRVPLHWAVMVAFPSGVDMLLSKGADVNRQDKFGISALHFAMLMENENIVTKLLSIGADVNVKDEDGRTPLHYACLSSLKPCPFIKNPLLQNFCLTPYSDTSTIVILMRAGCLLDLQDGDGYTPLDLALRCDNPSAVHALLTWGAKIHIANNPNESHCSQISVPIRGYSTGALRYHTVRLKQANLEMYNGNHLSELESLLEDSGDDLSPSFEQCEKELNEMARLKIGNFYLHDVFAIKKHSFIFDCGLKSLVFSTSTEENFIFYGHMLQATFLKRELRYQRINEAVLLPLRAETKSGDVALIPEEVKRMIFSFLPDEDLVSVIKAA